MNYLQILYLYSGLYLTRFICAGAHRYKRIVNGKLSTHDTVPYEVIILRKHNMGNSSKTLGYCSGSILDDNHVISAAHCFIKWNKPPYEWHEGSYLVIAGATDLNDTNRTNWVTVMVQKIYTLKTYITSLINKDTATIGDIAVLKLEKSLNLTENKHLRSISLAAFGDQRLYINKQAVVSGYGNYRIQYVINKTTGIGEWTGSGNYKLRSVNTRVLSNLECNSKWDLFSKLSSWARIIRYLASLMGLKTREITEKHICAEVNQRDPLKHGGVCRGDSGGPLIYSINTLIGVVNSSPPDCDERKAPGIYTRVSAFTNFIEKVQNYDVNKKDPEIRTTDPPMQPLEYF